MATPQSDVYSLPSGTTVAFGGRGTDPVAPPTGSPGGFTVTGALTGTQPFVAGMAIKQGDIPSGYGVAITGATAQGTIKSTWPDGSAQFIIVAGATSATSGVAQAVTPVAGNGLAGAVLTTADLLATGLTASISTDVYGSATWSGTDWSSPAETWITGPAMSSWVYRKPIGADTQLVGCLEVRLWSTGDVEVLPYVENGYLMVAAPGQRSATYTFTLAGTSRFSALIDLLNHQRTPLISGAALSFWAGTDKAFTVKHDAAYMMSTEMVPTYESVTSPTNGIVTGGPSTFTPLAQARFEADMGGGGYSQCIGVLPQWDVIHLTCTSSATWGILQRMAYFAGRYGIHYRDETTGKPIAFSARPNHVMSAGSGVSAIGGGGGSVIYTPTPTGTIPPNWDVAHHPSLGYFAALVTGRHYHMETAQFVATANYLKTGNTTRNLSQGLIRSETGAVTLRGAAWMHRSLAYAATITPDAHPLKSEFLASLSSNVGHYYDRYVAQFNNPFGMVHPYVDYNSSDTIYTSAAWQHDFFVAAWGQILQMRPNFTAAIKRKAAGFYEYIAQAVAGRLGTEAGWPYYDAVIYYETAYAPTTTPDWITGAGPWYATWRDMYIASGAGVPPAANPTGALRGGNWPAGTSFWGSIRASLAYCKRHATQGADGAWARMHAAPNISALDFSVSPEWSIIPATTISLPSWLASAPVNQWVAAPGTVLQGSAAWEPMPTGGFFGSQLGLVNAEGGTGIDEATSTLYQFNGGHLDYAGNELVSVCLENTLPAWQTRCSRSVGSAIKPYNAGGSDWAYNLDNKPNSRHAYQGTHFLRKLGKYFAIDGFTWPNANARTLEPSTWDADSGNWDAPGTWTWVGTHYSSTPGIYAKHPVTEHIYYGAGGGYSIYRLNTDTKAWSLLNSSFGSYLPTTECGTIDITRNALAVMSTKAGTATSQFKFFLIHLVSGLMSEVSFTASAALTAFQALNTNHAGLHYNFDQDAYYYYFGGTGQGGQVWKITPTSSNTGWTIEQMVMTGATVPDGVGVANGNLLTRFRYVPRLKAVVALPSAASQIYVARVS